MRSKAMWKSVFTITLMQYVAICGAPKMLKWFADSWDITTVRCKID